MKKYAAIPAVYTICSLRLNMTDNYIGSYFGYCTMSFFTQKFYNFFVQLDQRWLHGLSI